MSRAARRPVFTGCTECGGRARCPRNGSGGDTCTAGKCKRSHANKNKNAEATVGLGDAAAQMDHEMMPPGKLLKDLEEILGERCCQLRQLSQKKRKNGPGSQYQQQLLVRGQFLEDDGDEDDSDAEDVCPEWNTDWLEAADLEFIAKEDVKTALEDRHKRVLEEL